MQLYDIEYNLKKATEIGIRVKDRINIPASQFETEEINIPGRDGVLIVRKQAMLDIIIKITFTFLAKEGTWNKKFRDARRWLMGSENKELRISDDPGYFYKVKNVTINESERTAKRIGEFEAEFLCNGCQFLDDGKKEYSIEEVKYNPYYIAKPVYKINGEGKCILTVNGKTMEANVGQNLTIDTERKIAYRRDGTLTNTAVKGDYEELYLKEGDNEISVTKGFGIKVIPKWRCL